MARACGDNMAGLACMLARSWAMKHLPGAHFSTSSLAAAAAAGPSTPQYHEPPVGAYTPVTKQLWQERIEGGGKPAEESSGVKTITYPFSVDKSLQELYRNPWGYIRIGRLLEDLDSLAGNVAYQHCYQGGPPLLVTASVDEICLNHPIAVQQDLTVSGRVVWTGTSSMDIMMQLQQQQYTTPSLVALFSFVNLDPNTKKAAAIKQLVPTIPEDIQIFSARQEIADNRRKARQQQAPGTQSASEAAAKKWVAPLLAEQRKAVALPALAAVDAVMMPSTSLQNTFVCQPQQRNMHGRVFGGFLMRRAYELAFATTYMFAGTRPIFLKCDEITFKKPVDIGDLLRFRSLVVHTATSKTSGRALVCVEVEASVAKPEKVESYTTNTFSFVFEVEAGKPLKRVLPTCEEEALKSWTCHKELNA